MRVFLDTNVLASAFATRGICHDVVQVTLNEHQLVVGETVLTELRRVLVRKFKVSAEDAEETDAFLRREADVSGKAPRVALSIRDASDVAVLEEAIAGAADVVVSGDRDLLDFAEKSPVRILSPRGFWDSLRKDEPDER